MRVVSVDDGGEAPSAEVEYYGEYLKAPIPLGYLEALEGEEERYIVSIEGGYETGLYATDPTAAALEFIRQTRNWHPEDFNPTEPVEVWVDKGDATWATKVQLTPQMDTLRTQRGKLCKQTTYSFSVVSCKFLPPVECEDE